MFRVIEVNPHGLKFSEEAVTQSMIDNNSYTLQNNNEVVDVIVRIFLVGTIDMGNSEDWQAEYIHTLEQTVKGMKTDKNCIIYVYNPRRKEGFDDNPEELEYQIKWELAHMELSNSIYMNILPDSKSPITLMELGIWSHIKDKLQVVCPKEFYRYENVRLVCEAYGIQYKNSTDEDWNEPERKINEFISEMF